MQQVLWMLTALVVAALPAYQQMPVVEIVPEATTVRPGDSVTVAVWIRNVTGVVGADVGIETDGQCLVIASREGGTLLPLDSEDASYTVLDEQTENATRLAAVNIDGDDTSGTGDGVYFSVVLDATCDAGIADVRVSIADVSVRTGTDPTAMQMRALSMDDGSIATQSVQITISTAPRTPVTAPSVPTQFAAAPTASQTPPPPTVIVANATIPLPTTPASEVPAEVTAEPDADVRGSETEEPAVAIVPSVVVLTLQPIPATAVAQPTSVPLAQTLCFVLVGLAAVIVVVPLVIIRARRQGS